MKKKFIVGVTGASGAVYAKALIDELLKRGYKIDFLLTDAGKELFRSELGVDLFGVDVRERLRTFFKGEITFWEIGDLSSPLASGSYRTNGMVVIPCSMATLASIANGMSSNLLERAADVILKEKRQLVVVPRETPLNTIHLKNMSALASAGADIVPAMPGFYHNPQKISDMVDFIVGKVLDLLGIENDLFKRWEEKR